MMLCCCYFATTWFQQHLLTEAVVVVIVVVVVEILVAVVVHIAVADVVVVVHYRMPVGHHPDHSRIVVVEGRVVDTAAAAVAAADVGRFVLVPIAVARLDVPTLISLSIDGNNTFFLQIHVQSIPQATNPTSILGERML